MKVAITVVLRSFVI